jgi:N-acylneuraminate cytidylyltransferase
VGQAIRQGGKLIENMIAIIPARSGSKGVPDKNIRLLGGHPLIAYSIAAAKLTGIDRVLISTDSKQYAEIATKYGAEAPFLRPAKLADDESTDYEFMQHAMTWMAKTEGEVAEYWVHLRPTTPLRDPSVLKEAANCLQKHPEAHSLRSAHPAPESPFKWFLRGSSGYFQGLREDLTPEKVNLPRQFFPTMYVPDGYVDIVRLSWVLAQPNLHGNHMYVFESPVCTEIDISKDFEFLEYQLNSSHLLKKYLDEYGYTNR